VLAHKQTDRNGERMKGQRTSTGSEKEGLAADERKPCRIFETSSHCLR
jgi:hypothetical protein